MSAGHTSPAWLHPDLAAEPGIAGAAVIAEHVARAVRSVATGDASGPTGHELSAIATRDAADNLATAIGAGFDVLAAAVLELADAIRESRTA